MSWQLYATTALEWEAGGQLATVPGFHWPENVKTLMCKIFLFGGLRTDVL